MCMCTHECCLIILYGACTQELEAATNSQMQEFESLAATMKVSVTMTKAWGFLHP